MNKILKVLNVVQEVSNEDRNKQGLDSLGELLKDMENNTSYAVYLDIWYDSDDDGSWIDYEVINIEKL